MAEKMAGPAKKSSVAELESIVRKLVAEILEVEPESIDPEAQLVEDLGMDSMKALEILAAIEKRFRVKVPEDSLPKLTTLNRVIEVAKQYARA